MRQMKDSRIEWIGSIPNHWTLQPLRGHLEEIREINNPIQTTQVLSLTNKLGVVPYEEKGEQGNKSKENHNEYKLAYPNTIVANSMNILIGSVGVCNYFGCVSPVYYVFQPKQQEELKFLDYIFQSQPFQKELRRYAKGILEIRLRVSSNDILRRQVAFPPLAEQKKIVDFLETKLAQVDELIANQQAQIEKLKEYKQSIITEAVTKGLDKSAPMKDSGIAWLGDIPLHWIKIKNKVLFKNVSIKGYGDATVLSLYRDHGVVPKDSRDDNHNVTSLDTDSYKYIQPDDLVINKMKAWSGSIAITDYEGIVSPAYYTCKVNYRYVDKRFIHHYLRNKHLVGVYKMYSAGLREGQWDLSIDDFQNIEIVVPPTLGEQIDIAKFIDDKCDRIDKLITLKQQKIEKLQEYKKSLIYEYVTGKKEVV